MDVKKPELFCKQIEKLKKHGCSIDDFDQAIMILNKINYYKLSAYFLPFKEKDGTYMKGTSLLRVYKIYEFDRKLSALLYGVIQTIEVFVKTQIAYYHSKQYGSLGYMDNSNVNSKFKIQHEKLIKQFKKEIERNKELPFVKHYLEQYNGNFPLWVAVELFTLGNTSQFYSQLKTADKKIIAKSISYITETDCTYSQLASCLKCLTELRNKCAHFARLYYTRFTSTPNLPDGLSYNAFISGNKYIYLYSYIYVLKALYPFPEKWSGVVTDLKALIEEYTEFINIKHIGFPEDWEELLS
ncbi:MAG: Abi family protein [Oscillospiraceae bacterium]|nr:Abi family protein [Oscillospiraceae bacterium]